MAIFRITQGGQLQVNVTQDFSFWIKVFGPGFGWFVAETKLCGLLYQSRIITRWITGK